ncbi:MAG: HAMP domain-containing protein [Desulfobacterales bacterium]|nr:HAMP domain-containing protein [Desulfobacterales bacterium]
MFVTILKNKLFIKIFTPLALVFIAIGFVGYLFIDRQLESLNKNFINQIAQHKVDEVINCIEISSQKALEIASLFTISPEAIKALKIANSGNISDEKDEMGQTARQMLRDSLKPMLDGFALINGQKLKLHFHLPNAKSLVRLWREKQIQIDEKWIDISDDISDFRNTVIDVNKTGKSIKGIELGRGGFVIRGLVPVKSEDGKILGSVEVLDDFEPMLKTIIKNEKQSFYLYMNLELLNITHRLQNKQKYPIINNKYVLVAKTSEEMASVDVNLLDKGRKALNVAVKKNNLLSTFPLNDYAGRQIGIIVFVSDISNIKSLIGSIKFFLNFILCLILFLISILVAFLLSKMVIQPIEKINIFSKKISEGDLTQTLSIKQKDEVGKLSESLNEMISNIARIIASLNSNINTIADSSKKIETEVNSQASVTSEQSASVSEITSTMTQLSSSSKSISEHCSLVAQIAENALTKSEEGAASVETISKLMGEINQDNKNNIEMIVGLGKQSKEIGKIMEIITGIANQTKLIAFNAALEASSSGEAGKRFSVVAGEIRRLANNVTESTIDIKTKIVEIQNAIEQIIVGSENNSLKIQNALDHSFTTKKKLTYILEEVRSTTNSTKEILLSAQQQDIGIEQVLLGLMEIDEGSRQNVSSINHLSLISKKFTELSTGLKLLIDMFKVNSH